MSELRLRGVHKSFGAVAQVGERLAAHFDPTAALLFDSAVQRIR